MGNWIYFDEGAVDLNEVIAVCSISAIINSGSRKPGIEFTLRRKENRVVITFISDGGRDVALDSVKTKLKNIR